MGMECLNRWGHNRGNELKTGEVFIFSLQLNINFENIEHHYFGIFFIILKLNNNLFMSFIFFVHFKLRAAFSKCIIYLFTSNSKYFFKLS